MHAIENFKFYKLGVSYFSTLLVVSLIQIFIISSYSLSSKLGIIGI